MQKRNKAEPLIYVMILKGCLQKVVLSKKQTQIRIIDGIYARLQMYKTPQGINKVIYVQ